MLFQLLLMALSAVAIASIGYALLADWISSNRTSDSMCAVTIRKKLSSGKYRVVTGIFDTAEEIEASNSWDVDKLDEELESNFGYDDAFVITL